MTLQAEISRSDLGDAGSAVRHNGADVGGGWLTIAILALPAAFMAAVAMQPWIDPGDLLRDPLAVAEMRQPLCCKVYYGAVSNLGVLLWTCGAAVCLFAAAVVIAQRLPAQRAIFLISASLLTGVLAIDDLFLVHENVLPALGVSQPVTYGAYGALGLAYLAVSWREILRHKVSLLAAAVVLLGTSATIDWVFHSDHPLRILLEDGAKLTGISAWVGFHVIAAWAILRGAPARRGLS
jgi:hypothetical protein